MLRIAKVRPLDRRRVRLTLTDGSVVERDLSALLDGVGVFERITSDERAFRQVYVEGGTIAWPGEVDIAPETIIWEYPMADTSWHSEFAEFLEDVRLDRKPSAGLDDAFVALNIVDKIYQTSGYGFQRGIATT